MLETLLQPSDTEERCGFIMKDGNAIELQNVAQEPGHSFEMEPVAALTLIKTGEVAATWHTHPGESANLSGEDYTSFLGWPDLEHHIIGTDGVATFRVKDGVVYRCA